MRPLVDFGAWERLPRLGWVREPSPLRALPELAESLGIGSLWVKCDDQLRALGGGSKPRKLDFLLAREPFAGAPVWQSLGAIGSGHLLALARAAQLLARRLVAHCFPQIRTQHAVANAALLHRTGAELRVHGSRIAVALSHPGLLLGRSADRAAVVPAGATSASGTLGLVAAGLELAEQLRSGALPTPHWIYVAFGSGGAAAGLSVGLAMAGLAIRIRAVAAVEAVLANSWRLESLQRGVLRALRDAGVIGRDLAPAPVAIDHSALGHGYGDPTPDCLRACVELAAQGVAIEPAYTAKAVASLRCRAREHARENVLIWNTARRLEPDEPSAPPPELERWLIDPEQYGRHARARRWFLRSAGAGALGAVAWHRFADYTAPPQYAGQSFSPREVAILMTAARAVVPLADGQRDVLLRVVRNVDRYVGTLPVSLRRQLRLAILGLEQATPFAAHLDRFTRLEPADAERYLAELSERGGTLGRLQRAVRDLCLLGYYQLPESFEAIGYGGPWVTREELRQPGAPDALCAPSGRLPAGVAR